MKLLIERSILIFRDGDLKHISLIKVIYHVITAYPSAHFVYYVSLITCVLLLSFSIIHINKLQNSRFLSLDDLPMSYNFL